MSDAIEKARKELNDLVDSARLCLANGRALGTLVLTYAGIDAAAALWAKNLSPRMRKENFLHWVDKYLLPLKPLKVTALDLYAARCGVVHTLTARSDLSEAGKARRLLYGWGKGEAETFDRINEAAGFTDRYAAVQVEDLIDGLAGGVAALFDDVNRDPGLRGRVEERGDSFYARLTPQQGADFAAWCEERLRSR